MSFRRPFHGDTIIMWTTWAVLIYITAATLATLIVTHWIVVLLVILLAPSLWVLALFVHFLWVDYRDSRRR